jgi:intracellular sulfur oxidation DsrE/DsrF family protein
MSSPMGPACTCCVPTHRRYRTASKNLKDLAFPCKIQFSACNNTKEGMEKKEGHPINVLSEATIVPSGVVRLMELQEKGWSYVRP